MVQFEQVLGKGPRDRARPNKEALQAQVLEHHMLSRIRHEPLRLIIDRTREVLVLQAIARIAAVVEVRVLVPKMLEFTLREVVINPEMIVPLRAIRHSTVDTHMEELIL